MTTASLVGTPVTPEEIYARLLNVCNIVVNDYNSPGMRDQELFAAAKNMPDPRYRFRESNGGHCLELVPVVGMGCTHFGWSDRNPYEVVKVVSDKCLEIRPMHAEGGLKEGATFIPGGFVGHFPNQHEDQTWVLSSAPDAPVTRIRLGKRGWKGKMGDFLVGKAFKHYDYNF